MKLVKLFSQKPAPKVNEALASIATEYYGAEAEPDVLEAWSKFSDAFREYPFAPSMLYFCPIQLGPANLLYPAPTGYTATMVGYSYDDLKSWVSIYPVNVFAAQFERMATGWQPGLAAFERAAVKTKTSVQSANAKTDLRIAEAAYLHFKSVGNQVRFTQARNTLLKGSLPAEQRQRQIHIIKSAAGDEIRLAQRLYQLAKEDSRIGFEASNQYHYLPLDLVEKVVNCEYALKHWLPGLSD